MISCINFSEGMRSVFLLNRGQVSIDWHLHVSTVKE